MMKRIVYTFLLLAMSLHMAARTPMRNWLVTMPDSVMPLLTKNDRLDFIDFYDAKMAAVVTNRMEGKSRMDTLTADYVHFAYTPSTEVEMKLLPVNDSTDVICMVTTMKAAVHDSRIDFFDKAWQPLDVSDYMDEPCMEDFRSTTHQGDSAQRVWSKIDIFFRTYHLCAEEATLKCVLTALDYLSKEDREEVKPYVHQALNYRWTNGRLVCDE
jgi:hypothetical protein